MKQTYTLSLVKSTAGTHVYGQVGVQRSEAVFPALYLPRSLFPSGPTQTVTVVLEIPG